MDEKRELEFELIMKDEQAFRVVAREEKRLEEMGHKIDVCKMAQVKVQDQSKCLSRDLCSYKILGGSRSERQAAQFAKIRL